MKKGTVKSVAMAALLAVASSPAMAAEATVGLDLASAYVFRGATFNDGLVAQPYLDVSGLPVDIGFWGNIDIDDYDNSYESGEFSEIDVWASYTLPIEGIDASIGYAEYTYPGLGGAELVDGEAVATRGVADREVSLSVGMDVPLAPAVGLYYGIDGGIEKNFYADFGIGHEMELAEGVGLSLGALIGYFVPDEGADGFNQYELSASLSYSFLSLGVTYVGQVDDEVLVDAEDGGTYDVEVIGTLGMSYAF